MEGWEDHACRKANKVEVTRGRQLTFPYQVQGGREKDVERDFSLHRYSHGDKARREMVKGRREVRMSRPSRESVLSAHSSLHRRVPIILYRPTLL